MTMQARALPSTPASRLDAEQAILALLLAPDGKKDNGEWRWAAPVEGKTRLVKELFLVEKETRSGADGLLGFRFTPGPYGPSSLELTNQLDVMLAKAKVGASPINSGRGFRLSLTPTGGRLAKQVWIGLPKQGRSDFFKVKSRVAPMSYRQFLLYVYRTYPEYTENSLIRDELLSDSQE
ncbi:conjugative plasmid protein [mine drainage metagenome]|uniref:Conjugative plasmid protein n=1 Tax=mine drainage metagenome TaxID=410659 RepID=T1AIC2_9ZZZZ